MCGEKSGKYTCNDFRQEMILVGLKKRLQKAEMTDEEKRNLLLEIKKLEKEMGL